MHNAQCKMHNAQCTVHSAQCTMHNAQWCTMVHTGAGGHGQLPASESTPHCTCCVFTEATFLCTELCFPKLCTECTEVHSALCTGLSAQVGAGCNQPQRAGRNCTSCLIIAATIIFFFLIGVINIIAIFILIFATITNCKIMLH